MQLLSDSWALSSPDPSARASCVSLPLMPACGSSVSLTLCSLSSLLFSSLVLSRLQGDFRGVGPSPVALRIPVLLHLL